MSPEEVSHAQANEVVTDMFLDKARAIREAHPFLQKIPGILQSKKSADAFKNLYRTMIRGCAVDSSRVRLRELPLLCGPLAYISRNESTAEYGFVPESMERALWNIYCACTIEYPDEKDLREQPENTGRLQMEHFIQTGVELRAWLREVFEDPEMDVRTIALSSYDGAPSWSVRTVHSRQIPARSLERVCRVPPDTSVWTHTYGLKQPRLEFKIRSTAGALPPLVATFLNTFLELDIQRFLPGNVDFGAQPDSAGAIVLHEREVFAKNYANTPGSNKRSWILASSY